MHVCCTLQGEVSVQRQARDLWLHACRGLCMQLAPSLEKKA